MVLVLESIDHSFDLLHQSPFDLSHKVWELIEVLLTDQSPPNTWYYGALAGVKKAPSP